MNCSFFLCTVVVVVMNNVNRRAQLGSFLDTAWSNDESVHNEQWNYAVVGIKQILINGIVNQLMHLTSKGKVVIVFWEWICDGFCGWRLLLYGVQIVIKCYM
ncbi:hypothetical protein PanWU01x14_145310 [Parasponia andersonii]|uniref:Uncharacterized protein n=1 Tax=Parasponia andersonii TaxID=3476 RepID=A0A2P5CK38_PARAD|nr:hypothetical protein PanWU01x14_145310 [Parasponia andersonii]